MPQLGDRYYYESSILAIGDGHCSLSRYYDVPENGAAAVQHDPLQQPTLRVTSSLQRHATCPAVQTFQCLAVRPRPGHDGQSGSSLDLGI